jgi:ribose 5-phosphate isomerase A
MDPIEQSKRLAAYQAVDNHVQPEHRVSRELVRFWGYSADVTLSRKVIGIGSGMIGSSLSQDSLLILIVKDRLCPMSWRGSCSREQQSTRGASSSQLVRLFFEIREWIVEPLSLGFQSKQLIVDAGLGLGDVDQYPTIDVTLDGADECACPTF